ncbi:hypothetical protein DFJ58DRAFT_725007 [Suillus subalutaceus]|uniref:uncharacterized protein n=1 Tax=Suillus subalutaceus TaxID=48586 RepID=UPI001B872C1D|nr:uncharacterized protein DFJ58DRAFT_725007 [Suillus subalutaceus]KAG1863584.1 hypothetical protein DFJ58DRAFT_725007 [Suillus subalutaceus]
MSDTSHSHNYGTRIRNNSILKPSARLRQSPQPRRIKPVPHPTTAEPTPNQSHFPIFPLPNVMLHPEDATSKVFHAIGRCFLSVDNRAMTIKDLAEMTLNFGLVCQNVSAAITLFFFVTPLSGTPADDDLVPALHSRVGGAPIQRQPLDSTCPNQNIPPGRHTNFRRGTIVWYLSKASGVSCPFSRAGILLSNYPASTSNIKPRKQSHDPMEKCGEKRKRFISRRCRATDRLSERASPSPSSSPVDSGYAESASSSSDEEEDEPERPPKVKLTLRLRPSPTTTDHTDIIDLSHDTSSDDDVDMSPAEPSPEPSCLPPYPRRSIAVPCYTPVSPPSLQYVFPPPPIDQSRGSASPPPDSDHEEDIDFDFSSDEEESRGVSVKVEDEAEDNSIGTSQNVRDMLDAWEDLDLNRARSYSCPGSGLASVARENESRHAVAPEVKVEELEMWEWEFDSGWAGACGDVEIKKEDASEALNGLSLSPTSVPWSGFPLSPMSPLTPSPTSPGSIAPLLGPRMRRKPSLERKNSVLDWQDAELLGPDSVHIAELELEWEKGTRRTRFASPAPDASSSSSKDCQMADLQPLPERKDQVVVVHTCVPCDPPVSATQVEGIPVYQTTLPLRAPHTTRTLLRRLDTDFVNLTPLLAAFSPSSSPCAAAVPALPPSAVRFEHPNSAVAGVWVSLDCAREFLRTSVQAGAQQAERACSQDETLRTSVEVFLSDELVMRFPSALRDFWRASKPGRMLGQFGVCFEGGRVVGSQRSSSPSSLVSARVSSVSPPQSTSPPSRAESYAPPSSSELHPRSSSLELHSHSASSLPPSSLPMSASPALPTSIPRVHEVWSLREDAEPEAEVEAEPVLPAFDIALAALASGLGPNASSGNGSACLGNGIDFGSGVDFGSARASLGSEHTGLDIGSGSTGLGVGCTDFGPGSADLGNGHGTGSGEPPLSPTEAEMFRVLCVCPDWEEKEVGEDDIWMDGRDQDAGERDQDVDSERDHNTDNQCDKDTDADADADGDVDVEIVEEEPRSLKDGRSLRRSKRVADAVARTRGVRPRMRGPRHA